MEPILAQSFTADGKYGIVTNLEYLATGFIIVIGALSILWGACWLMGLVFIRKAAAEKRAKEAAQAAEVHEPAPDGEEESDPVIIAVIAAAITATLHQPLRIRSVRSAHQAGSNETRHNAWAHEGRSTHFQSHKVR